MPEGVEEMSYTEEWKKKRYIKAKLRSILYVSGKKL